MLDNQDYIVNKIINIIKNNGIPRYLSNWTSTNNIKNCKSEKQFIYKLNEFVQSYHYHSSIFVNRTKFATTISHKKMPSFYYDTKNKIGRIVYYEYFLNFNDEFEKSKQFIHLVKMVRETLSNWVEIGLLGLIIDLRYHKGGWFVPFVYSLYSLFHNKTLFAWSNNKVKTFDKKWISYIRNLLNYQTKQLNNKTLNIPIAVIIGMHTYSSGEFCASIFYRNDNNIKIFGQNTGGGLSVNTTFNITDNIKLNIPTQLVTTVDGQFHIDQYLKPNKKTTKPIDDAKEWIKSYESHKS